MTKVNQRKPYFNMQYAFSTLIFLRFFLKINHFLPNVSIWSGKSIHISRQMFGKVSSFSPDRDSFNTIVLFIIMNNLQLENDIASINI